MTLITVTMILVIIFIFALSCSAECRKLSVTTEDLLKRIEELEEKINMIENIACK